MRFKGTIEIIGINPYVLVDKDRAQQLHAGWKKPMPVLVQINGQPNLPWRVNMMPVGDGSFYLYLYGDVRKVSDTKVGDTVQIDLSFDAEYRGGPAHPAPLWFKKALDENATAKVNWEALIPSRKKEVLRYFAELKSDEAKERNLEKAIHVLSGKPGRFMARSWKDGS